MRYDFGDQIAVAIEDAGSTMVTVFPFHPKFTLASSSQLLTTTTTTLPSGRLNETARTPTVSLTVSIRTEPGLTNLLK